MRSAPERMNVIEVCESQSAKSFFIYKPTWDLIITSLKWCMGKTETEIMTRRGKCRYKKSQAKIQSIRSSWQLIIETLNWVLEETDIDPIQARKDLIPFA